MKGVLVLALVIASTATLFAANVEIKIPDAGWSIFFDAPRLSNRRELSKPGEFSYSASSGRFNISLFVGKPIEAGSRNRDTYLYYWSTASQNPTIAKETVTVSEITKYVRVEYDIVVNVQGRSIRQRNVNYYFTFRDRWVDLHISILRPEASDAQILSTFDETLGYGA